MLRRCSRIGAAAGGRALIGRVLAGDRRTPAIGHVTPAIVSAGLFNLQVQPHRSPRYDLRVALG